MSSGDQSNSTPQSADKSASFHYDTILEHIGQLGKFQLTHFLLLCFPAMFPGIIIMSFSFTGGIPRYRCFIEGCDNETNTNFEPMWLNSTMPWNWTESKSGCQRYNQTWGDRCVAGDDLIDQRLVSCDSWLYDKDIFESTIVSDFQLTCDDEWKQTFSSTMYMVGMFFGALTLSNVADIIGRRRSFLLISLTLSIVFTATTFSPNYVTFVILRFLCGLCHEGFFLVIFVWGIEAVGQKYRVICGSIYQVMFSIGSGSLGLIAYFVRDWRTLQLIVSIPMFLCVPLYWLLPESVRWLISKERYEEAEKILLKIAKMNKKTIPSHLLMAPVDQGEHVTNESSEVLATGQVEAQAHSDPKDTKFMSNLKNLSKLFKTPVLRKRILITFLAWIASVMGYYGITYSATNLAGDFHLNYALTMLIEIPSYLSGIVAMDKLGRRPTLSGGLLACGLSCLITGLVSPDAGTVRITFALIGKFFGALVFSAAYSYTSELFPTLVRSSASGLCSTSGRIGGILAPMIANMGRTVNPALPYIIFACVNIIVGFLCLLLPETKGLLLPETTQDAEEMEKYSLACLRCCVKKEDK